MLFTQALLLFCLSLFLCNDANARIVYHTDNTGNVEIWSMNDDGSHKVNLTNNPANDYRGVISRDGQKVAFWSNRDSDGLYDLYTMDIDGRNVFKVVDINSLDPIIRPIWSPDGTEIIFADNKAPGGDSTLYRINSDGTNLQGLYYRGLFTWNTPYDWSPDGSKILLTLSNHGNAHSAEIYEMDLASSSLTRLTNDAIWQDYMSYSHDGSQILFSAEDTPGSSRWDLYISPASAPIWPSPFNLTNNGSTTLDYKPTWIGPDDTKIAYTRRSGSNDSVWVINSDGTGAHEIASHGWGLSWAPGEVIDQIIFHTNRDGNFQIYRMNADGSSQTRVTNDLYDNFYACVSPDGRKIAFSTKRNSQFCISGHCDLYVINIDGTGLTQLTNVYSRNVYNTLRCIWSNDGSKVYFGGRDVSSGGYHQVWSVNADGTDQQLVLSIPPRDLNPMSFRPNGIRLSLHDNRGYADGSDNVQSTMNVDGTEYVKADLAPGPRDDFGRWSPDGNSFAYMRFRGAAPTQIFVMNGEGSDYPGINVTNDLHDNWYPYWSPDGKKIVYRSYQSGLSHIWLINSDGTNKTQLTTGNHNNGQPVWVAIDTTYLDNCPNDPNKTQPGICGCGVADTDTDEDGTADCNDECENDPNKVEPGICGCGISDDDSDGDGVVFCFDLCPNEDATGFDTDSDGCIDNIAGLTDTLEALVQEGVIEEELQNSLLSKVENAEKSATKDNICAAINQLESLKNQVNAQRGNKISDEAADEIIAYTDSVIAYLLSQLQSGESC
jgi:Tol biopolymer transport system component